MRASLVILLAVGLCGTLAQAQWTSSLGSTVASAVASDPVAAAVTKMMEAIVQPKAQILNTFTQTASAAQAALQQEYSSVKTQAEAALAAYEAQYCTPAALTTSKKVPATFVSHGFAITFDTGNCTFNETKFLVDGVKELDCFEPSISYVKTPANFTSHYIKAASFTGKQCEVTKSFGDETDKVLYVFDNSQPALDVNKLTAELTTEITNLLSSVSTVTASAFTNVFGR